VKAVAKPDDTILATCRSGGRSALAANLLAQAGFTKVYSIVDGMGGDKVDDPASVFNGMPMRNGWKNSGCPWTYSIDPDKLSVPGVR
jgi:rhodanese-related sulfurtransferase